MTDWAAWAEFGRMVAQAFVLIGLYEYGRWTQRRDDRRRKKETTDG